LDITDRALDYLIRYYTGESGVRKLGEKIADLFYLKCYDLMELPLEERKEKRKIF
jgi:ATP-dependent Lon protease